MANANVTTEQAYVFTLKGELRQLARHAEDVLEMLRAHGVPGPDQHIELAASNMRDAISIYLRGTADRTLAVVAPEDARAGQGPALAGFSA